MQIFSSVREKITSSHICHQDRLPYGLKSKFGRNNRLQSDTRRSGGNTTPVASTDVTEKTKVKERKDARRRFDGSTKGGSNEAEFKTTVPDRVNVNTEGAED